MSTASSPALRNHLPPPQKKWIQMEKTLREANEEQQSLRKTSRSPQRSRHWSRGLGPYYLPVAMDTKGDTTFQLPGPAQASVDCFDLLLIACRIHSLSWGHQQASCSWSLHGSLSRRMPFQVWTSFHQLHMETQKWFNTWFDSRSLKWGLESVLLACLPCVSTLTAVWKPLL